MTEACSERIPTVPASRDYYDLGDHGKRITTFCNDTQTWFNRGLTWLYSFNHAESAYCFEQAIAHDPCCAIAHWGLAYALGPNYNKPWERYDKQDLKICVKRAYDASRKAKEIISHASPLEKALINAVQFRYQTDYVTHDLAAQNKAYAAAMESVYREFKDDLDIAALYADALMNLTPWTLWDLFTGKPTPEARTMEVQEVLETALERDGAYRHPGLLHFYIHFIEMSPTPERGIILADHLRSLVPDAGHMHHMPTHLDILVGDWRRSVASNQASTVADERYFTRSGGMNFYTFYRMHNYHSLIYAAMFAGQSRVALDTVNRMEATIPEALLRWESPPMIDWLEQFLTTRAHIMVRFGMWQELIDIEFPQDQELYSFVTATIHYAKGVALAATGQVTDAEKQRELFREATARVPESRRVYNSTGRELLAVAQKMLDGEIEYRGGDYDEAFESLREANDLEDRLPYSEPWAWMQPTRHAYAALLLEQGHVDAAAAVYKADLGLDDTLIRPRRHPNNVWALQGYHECLTRLGKTEEATAIKPAVGLALSVADVSIQSSCFCRRDTSHAPRVTNRCERKTDCHGGCEGSPIE
ncbi:TPR domain protein [Penicillium capsulatum]|uniref:TPR domain protein n=1 Tax=Penicillium capsulatum TaxID=69766 RepID=A0A9W9IPB7_9EURO|nr:TPR domain protein [Penicillium capsulatum]KAJ6130636.1 TPR domain protein [Penicillium capsulatum]